jgi:hypothetical protein
MEHKLLSHSFIILLGFIVCVGSVLGACSNNENSQEDAAGQGDWYRPSVGVTWQWQLLGEINTTYDVEIYDVDLFDVSEESIAALQASGKKVICYFSAGSWEDWRGDAAEFPAAVRGSVLDGWENERWLDIRSQELESLMRKRLELAAQKGCDGVEPDNMDGYQNESGFDLTGADQIAYNIFIANESHAQGLSVGLKNDLGQIETLVSYYDFSVNEQCFEYDECDLLDPFIQAGKPVLSAEYEQELIESSDFREQVCARALAKQFSTLILPLDLDDSFRYACGP